jgi:hypothetical protein
MPAMKADRVNCPNVGSFSVNAVVSAFAVTVPNAVFGNLMSLVVGITNEEEILFSHAGPYRLKQVALHLGFTSQNGSCAIHKPRGVGVINSVQLDDKVQGARDANQIAIGRMSRTRRPAWSRYTGTPGKQDVE